MSDPLTGLVKKIDQRVNEAAGHAKSGPELGTYVISCNNSADTEGHALQRFILGQAAELFVQAVWGGLQRGQGSRRDSSDLRSRSAG